MKSVFAVKRFVFFGMVVVVISACLALEGCAGKPKKSVGDVKSDVKQSPAERSGQVNPAEKVEQRDLTGTWDVLTMGGTQRQMTIIHKGTTFTGEVAEGPVSGTISGNKLTIILTDDPETKGEAVITGDLIEGTFVSSEEDYRGSWSAEKITTSLIME